MPIPRPSQNSLYGYTGNSSGLAKKFENQEDAADLFRVVERGPGSQGEHSLPLLFDPAHAGDELLQTLSSASRPGPFLSYPLARTPVHARNRRPSAASADNAISRSPVRTAAGPSLASYPPVSGAAA